MADVLALRGLRVLALCGALEEEQHRRQPFAIDLEVAFDAAKAGESDDLADTVDYGALTAEVVAVANGERFVLMERFAQRVSEVVLADRRVESVGVTVTKLRPPVPEDLATASVSITRIRAS